MPLSFNGKDEEKMITYNLSRLLKCNVVVRCKLCIKIGTKFA